MKQLRRRKPISLIRLLLIILIFVLAGIYMSSALPHTPVHYHDKSKEIIHKKKVRNTKESINQHFKFKIKVKDNQMRLLMQKDGQRSKRIKKESEVKGITMDVIEDLLLFMDVDKDKLKIMNKSDMVEFMCLIFQIPTKDAMKMCDTDCINIIQNQIEMIEEEPMIYNLIEYILDRQTNMTIIADIIEMCEEEQVDLFGCLFSLWMEFIDAFQVDRNSDLKFKKQFYSIIKLDKIKEIQNDLQTDIQPILNEYNANNDKHVKLKGFWFSFSLQTLKLFNYSIKHFIIASYIKTSTNESQVITEERQCSIYKYFGSSLHSLQKKYKAKNYGEEKSNHLLHIIDKCLLSYDTFENEEKHHQQDEFDDSNNEYLKVPLILRMQNRGHLRIINETFYKNVAVEMYAIIYNDVNRIFSCYDPKQVRAIEKKIVDEESIFKSFDDHIGEMDTDEERKYKQKALQELAHKVTSRFVMSMIKRHQKYDGHVGEFRTGVKTLSSRK